MNPSTQELGPVSGAERITSLDVLRGVALLGILLMNITGFGLNFWAYVDPTVQGGSTGYNLYVWIMNNMFFEGTMRAMFSMLFGVGMVLITSMFGIYSLIPCSSILRKGRLPGAAAAEGAFRPVPCCGP